MALCWFFIDIMLKIKGKSKNINFYGLFLWEFVKFLRYLSERAN